MKRRNDKGKVGVLFFPPAVYCFVKGAMVENSDGNITVLLLNERSEPKDFEIIFETPVSLDLNAYVYNPETVVCSEEIPPLKADFKVKGVTQSIKGTIPPGGVMAYSTK